MLPTVLSIFSLLLGIAILLVGSGLLGTLLALRGGLEGFIAPVIGLVMSAYFAGFFAGTFLCPRIIRRVGHIRSFAMFAAVASSAAIVHVLVIDPWAWAALRVVTGGCLVGLYMVIESWLNTKTPNERRGRVFAIYMAVTLLALALGQALVATGAPAGFTLFGIVSIAFSLALVPIALTSVAQPDPVPLPRLGLRRLYETSTLGVAGAFASGLVLGAFWGIGPLFAQRIGLDTPGIATFMSAAILGGAALQMPVGRLSDRYDRRRVLATVCAAGAVCALAVPVVMPHSFATGIAFVFLYGGLAFSVYPIGAAHLNDQLAPEDILDGSSGLLLLHGLGAAIGPTASGVLMRWLGPGSLFVYFAIVFVALAVFAARRVRAAAPIPVEARTDVSVPRVRAATAALQMVSPAEPEPAVSPSPDTSTGQTGAKA